MKRFSPTIGRFICLAAFVGVWGLDPSVATAETALQVGFFTLWGGSAGADAASFVNSLDAWPGLSAKLASKSKDGDSWRAVPGHVEPSAWLSLVAVLAKDGRQCDFLVFAFSDRDGTVRYAGRRPSRIPMEPPQYWFSVPPGPNQIPENAVRETATDYLFREAAAGASVRPALRLSAKPWEAPADGSAKPGNEMATRAMPLDTVEALCFAAAFEAGWRPTAGGAADTALTLSMAEDANVFVSVKAEAGAGAPGFTRFHIPRESLYNHLVALFRRYRDRDRILDGCAYGGPGTRFLGWADGRLLVAEGQGVRAVDPASGRVSWSLQGEGKKAPTLDILSPSGGPPIIIRCDRQIRRLAADSGKEHVLAPAGEGDDASGRLDLAPDGRLAAVDGGKLLIFENGTQTWSWAGAADAQPVWSGSRVIVVGADAAVHALDPAAHTTIWRQPLAANRTLRLFASGGLLLADTGRALVSLDPATGETRWSADTGDVLIGDPVVMDGRVFAAVKPNRLRVWDAATGASKAARDWPTWIRAAAAAPTAKGWSIACVDLRQRLSVLNPDTLATGWDMPFPRGLSRILVHGTNVPSAWALARTEKSEGEVNDFLSDLATADVTAPLKPAWLVSDDSGFIYAIASE
jgi:hypothetical protein